MLSPNHPFNTAGSAYIVFIGKRFCIQVNRVFSNAGFYIWFWENIRVYSFNHIYVCYFNGFINPENYIPWFDSSRAAPIAAYI